MKRKHLPIYYFLCVLSLCSTLAFGQKRAVSGKITDSNGDPLPGVSVLIKGTNTGTITNAEGAYTIPNASADQVLIFSGIGLLKQEQPIGEKSTISVQLLTDTKTLNEVVVTALGIQKEKRTLAFASQTVKGADLVKAREPNPINGLIGKVAGLNVGANSEILRAPQVLLRGGRPLYVVDGVPINSDTWNISPDDIESMDILKGPSGTALYGFRAQNGVIMITTKKGSKDPRGFSVEFNSSTMADNGMIAKPQVQDMYGPGDHGVYEFVDGKGGGKNDGDYDIWGPKLNGQLIPQYDSPIDPATGKRTATPWLARGVDNLGRFLQTGILSTNNLAISAKSEKADLRFSVSHSYQKGVVPNTSLNMSNFNTSLGYQFSPKLRFESNINYNRQYTPNTPDVNYGPNSLIYNIILWGGADWSIDEMKNYWQPGREGVQQIYAEYQRYNNPWFVVKEWLRGHYKNDVYGYSSLKYDFNKNLNLQLRTQITTYDLLRNEKMPYSATSYGREEARGDYREDRRALFENNTDLLLNHNIMFGSSGIGIRSSIGGSARNFRYNSSYGSTDYLNVPGVYNFANSRNPVRVFNYDALMRVYSGYYTGDIALNKYANVALTGRWDKTSTLPQGRNVGFYPSAGISTVLNDYLNIPSAISFLKLRASYALVKEAFTNATIGPAGFPIGYGDAYQSSFDGPSYGTTVAYSTSRPYNNEAAAYFSTRLLDPNIRPSARTNYEAGLEMKFLKNRLGLDVTYFKYLDGPRIFALTLPESTGYNSLITNGIESERKGFEVSLVGNVLKSNRGLNWDVMVNWSNFQEYLNKIYGDQTVLSQFYKIGDRLDRYFGRAFVRTQDGQIVNDNSGRPIYNPVSQYLGNTNSDYAFGINNRFNYKNWTLSFQFDGRIGGVIENYIQKQTFRGGRNIQTVQGAMGVAREQDTKGVKTWVGEGVRVSEGTIKYDVDGNITNYGELKFVPNTTATFLQDYISRYYNSNEGNMINRSFVKLRELQIGYSLPAGLLGKGIKQASISLVGRNLLYFSHAKDVDVEQFVGYDIRTSTMQTPSFRRYGINLNLTF